MKVDGNVIINYNGFHIPFDDYDEFSFAVKADKFDRLKARHVLGAGMQAMFDHMSPEEMIDNMRHAENEEDAELDVSIMIQADEGTTISGDDIADMLEERRSNTLFGRLFFLSSEHLLNHFVSSVPA